MHRVPKLGPPALPRRGPPALKQDHCLVCSGVFLPSGLLRGTGLHHWDGYALSAVRSGDGIFGVLGRQAELSPADREYVCAVAAMLGTAIGMTRERHRAVEEERQRRRLARYLSPQVSARLVKEDFASICCGERVEAAVLFSDICGFTRLSARLEPSQVVWMLNRYFSEMTAVVFEHGGMVDKFMGDGLMAVFGVPEPMEAPADAAVSCARGMLIALERLSLELRAKELPPLESGIGLHIGEAIFGAVGDGDYSDLTLIGPAVNLASRVESATRSLDARVLLTQEILDACVEPPSIAAASSASLKGIPGSLTLYRPRWG